jgi:DNA-binding IscR family transcriptional regulator
VKLSTRGRYGIKAMVDLAVEYGNGPVSVATLAAYTGYFAGISGTTDRRA